MVVIVGGLLIRNRILRKEDGKKPFEICYTIEGG
jgi:hypothetical protein